MLDPVLLYSPDGTKTRWIAAVDAPGWIAAGWGEQPPLPSLEQPQELPITDVKRKSRNATGNAVPEN